MVKNAEPSSTTATNFFTGRRGDKVPRWDKMMAKANQSTRSQSYKNNQSHFERSQINSHLATLIAGQTEMKRNFPSEINTKEFKQAFLRG